MTANVRFSAANGGLFIVMAIVLPVVVFLPLAALDTSLTETSLAEALLANLYVALMVHIAITLYDGRFTRWRTWTWIGLILVWVSIEAASFAGYVMPWGQMQFWLATKLAQWLPLSEATLEWLSTATLAPLHAPALVFAALLADLAARHGPAWRGRLWRLAGLAAIACVVGSVGLGILANAVVPPGPPSTSPSPFDPSLTPTHIVPPWQVLPYYSILRAPPDKLAGVIAMFAALLLPVIWPWTRVDRLRASHMRGVWITCWLAYVAAFLGLGYLGAQQPADGVILAAQVLAAYVLVFLSVLPPVLGLATRHRQHAPSAQ